MLPKRNEELWVQVQAPQKGHEQGPQQKSGGSSSNDDPEVWLGILVEWSKVSTSGEVLEDSSGKMSKT